MKRSEIQSISDDQCRTEQNRTEQNRTDRTIQNTTQHNTTQHNTTISTIQIPGIETSPTTDIMFKLGIRAARTAAFMAGSIASVRVAPKARRVSDSCFLSATSESNLSTATAGPEIELPIIMPAVGTCKYQSVCMLKLLRGITVQCFSHSFI